MFSIIGERSGTTQPPNRSNETQKYRRVAKRVKKPMTKKLIVTSFLFAFFLAGCAKTPDIPKAQAPLTEPSAPIQSANPNVDTKTCEENIEMVGSSNNFVRFKHSPSVSSSVEAKAFEWCQQHKKRPFIQKQRCGVCCSSSYFCR